MIETTYRYQATEGKLIERIIDDAHINLNHMVLPQGAALPEHYSNSNVYMVIIRGTMSITLDDQETHEYAQGDILTIPYHTKMNVENRAEEVLEFFVFKSPNPKDYRPEH